MKPIDLESFKASCQKKRCLRNTMITPQCPKDYKQEQCYIKFIQKNEKDKVKQEQKRQEQKENPKELKVDKLWEETQKEVWKRDQGQCQFCKSLTTKEYTEFIKPHLWGDFKKIDCAHILPKGSYPKLKYDSDDIVLLYRYVHSSIDSFIDPITRKNMTKEEHEQWWRNLIGDERYERLLNKVRTN